MPSIMWILVSISGGFFAGFTLSWQICLAACGVLAWLAAAELVPSATILYFAAACAVAVSGPRPVRGFHSSTRPDPELLGERMRLRAASAIDRASETDAPTARALLVADQSEIPRDVKQAYADAGIVHMLAISGLHVSIVAASLALVLNLIRIPGRLASFMTAGIIIGYVFMLGFPPPALRAAVMVCTATAAHASQRHTSRWSILALGGIVPLVKPETEYSAIASRFRRCYARYCTAGGVLVWAPQSHWPHNQSCRRPGDRRGSTDALSRAGIISMARGRAFRRGGCAPAPGSV